MPLIDLFSKPEFQLRHLDEGMLGPDMTAEVIHLQFAAALPELVMKHKAPLNLANGTTADGIQVMNHRFNPRDVNVPDVWLKIQFSEPLPKPEGSNPDFYVALIRAAVRNMVKQWFERRSYRLDEINFGVDLIFGPTHGFLEINGRLIDW